MKHVFFSLLAVGLLCTAVPAMAADTLQGGGGSTSGGLSDSSLCSRYLSEGKAFRTANRYELARQSYAQALSICQRDKDIATAKQGLNTIELLLRTMR